QVFRRRADHDARGGELLRDQPGRRRRGDPKPDVEALAHQIHEPLAVVHVEAHLRIELREARQVIHQVQLGEGGRRGHPQHTTRLAAPLVHLLLGLGHRREDLQAVLVETSARVRQAQPPRRPVKEPRRVRGLELRDALAHDGAREPQPSPGGREASCRDDVDESVHGVQAVHVRLRAIVSIPVTVRARRTALSRGCPSLIFGLGKDPGPKGEPKMTVQLLTNEMPKEWYQPGDRPIYLADVLDDTSSSPMSVGFAKYAAGASNDWTLTYAEVLVVTTGRAGEAIFLPKGTALTYRAEEASEVVYVSYPHWAAATRASEHARALDEYRAVPAEVVQKAP